ncbi:MAG: C39 family peptidase [Oscillospiraceae bacterium]|nr:C39 family peptidase [Oscillospiraceae bacterium]
MIEKLIAILKKYYPVILAILATFFITGYIFSKKLESEKINQTVHTLAMESTSAEIETITETETESSTELETEATTQPETSEPPEEILLEDVPYYSQKNILPTGCEIISAKMLLEYYTHEESEIEDMLNVITCQYPKEKNGRTYAPHPENAFIGSPWDSSSFGCFAPVIVKMLNHLLPKNYQAVDTTGTDLQELAETYLPQGTPVLVWATIYMQASFPNVSWYLYNERGYATDKEFQWLANEHCMVLVGYDEKYYYFNDPYESNGLISFRRDISEKRYEEIGYYSLVVQEKIK